MKFSILVLSLILVSSCSHKTTPVSKALVYDSQGIVTSGRFAGVFPQTSITLKDYSLNYTYVLDSSHVYISAYDSVENILWKVDPYIGNLSSNDRSTRTITDIYFGESTDILLNKPYKVLWVRYGRAGGYLDLKTGKFRLVFT